MDIKKHTFDVLNVADLDRSLRGCYFQYNDKLIELTGFTNDEDDHVAVNGRRIRTEPGALLYGREFRLGPIQTRALFDPDNLLPRIRSGHVNILRSDGTLDGSWMLRRKIGGYVRGYGPRSCNWGQIQLAYDLYQEYFYPSDSANMTLPHILGSAFAGGRYVTARAALTMLASMERARAIAIAPNLLVYGSGTTVYSVIPELGVYFRLRVNPDTDKVEIYGDPICHDASPASVIYARRLTSKGIAHA